MAHAIDPRSVAIIGATEDRNKVGGRPIHYMRRHGFAGGIFPVNPRRAEVQGLRCYPDLGSIAEPVDVAIIALGAEAAISAMGECATHGVKTAIVMSSGFGETGEAGRILERRLLDTARGGGLRVIGPNCQGVANFRTGAIMNFSTMFMEVEPADGRVAIISQSGAASVMPYALLRERGIGVRYLAATGNDADVGVAELLERIIEDPEIKVVLLYLEAIKNADTLARAADRARRRDIAIIALKSGTSARGATAASSHTGALATEDAVVSAFFRKVGIWRAREISDLVDAVPLYLAGRDVGSNRVLVLSHSGAVGVLCADTAERLGVPLSDLDAGTLGELSEIVPSFGAIRNPVDLTAGLLSEGSLFSRSLDVLARDPGVDVIHIGIPVAGEGYDIAGMAETAAQTSAAVEKPLLIAAPQRAVRDAFSARGLPTYQHDAVAIGAIHQYGAHRRLMREFGPATIGETRRPDHAGSGSSGGERTLSEADSLSLARSAGLSVAPYRVCSTLIEAERAFAELNAPCVLKGCSAAVPHKSEHDLVFLKIETVETLRRCFDLCRRRLLPLDPDGSVIVASMVSGRREMIIGGKRDPVFGPIVLIGDGGKYIEALRDYRLLAAPFSERDVIRALKQLRIWPILAGVRGEVGVDFEAFAAAAVAVGDLLEARPDIASIDLNPIFVKEAGDGAVVADALVSVVRPGP